MGRGSAEKAEEEGIYYARVQLVPTNVPGSPSLLLIYRYWCYSWPCRVELVYLLCGRGSVHYWLGPYVRHCRLPVLNPIGKTKLATNRCFSTWSIVVRLATACPCFLFRTAFRRISTSRAAKTPTNSLKLRQLTSIVCTLFTRAMTPIICCNWHDPPSLLELPYRSIHNETRVRRENSEDGQGINRHHGTPDGELRHLPIRLCTGTSGIDRRPCCLWLSVPRRVPVYRGDYLYYRRRVQMLAVVCLARYGQEGLAIQIEIGKIKWLTLSFVLVETYIVTS